MDQITVNLIGLMVPIWMFCGTLSFLCFRGSRDDGDRTPQGKMARGMAFLAGCFFALMCILPLGDVLDHWRW